MVVGDEKRRLDEVNLEGYGSQTYNCVGEIINRW